MEASWLRLRLVMMYLSSFLMKIFTQPQAHDMN